MFFLHKWKKNLESDIDCMEESMQPYIALFYAFRKIRHDFANYVQTLQLFAEVENYDEKKKMKKMTYYLAAFSPSGKMILFTKKKITMEMPPLSTVVPML